MPRDNQGHRWAVWGAMIGAAATLLAGLMGALATLHGPMSNEAPSPPKPIPGFEDRAAALGLETECQTLSQSDHADAILAAISAKRLADAPIARVAGSAQPVRLRAAPGETQTGTLATNTRVRVVCRLQNSFAVIKQENGAQNGVVERNALLVTD